VRHGRATVVVVVVVMVVVSGGSCAGVRATERSKKVRGGRVEERGVTRRAHTGSARSADGGEVVEERHSERDAARWHVSIAEGSGARCGRRCTQRESLPRTPKE